MPIENGVIVTNNGIFAVELDGGPEVLPQHKVDARVHAMYRGIKTIIQLSQESNLSEEVKTIQYGKIAETFFDNLRTEDDYNGHFFEVPMIGVSFIEVGIETPILRPGVGAVGPDGNVLNLRDIFGALQWLSPHLKLPDPFTSEGETPKIAAPYQHRWKILL